MHGQVHQVVHLAGGQAHGAHVIHLELEHQVRRHPRRQACELVPQRLRGLHRDLLAHDGARQRGKGIATGLQGQVGKARDQALHHAVAAHELAAGLGPVGRRAFGRRGQRYLGLGRGGSGRCGGRRRACARAQRHHRQRGRLLFGHGQIGHQRQLLEIHGVQGFGGGHQSTSPHLARHIWQGIRISPWRLPPRSCLQGSP